jgi:hypothetical protein
MAVSPELIGPATLAMTQSITLFSGFLPRFTDIKNGSRNDPGFATDVHIGEVAAAGLTIGIGVIATGLTGSNVPLVVSIIMCVGLVALYESALNYSGPVTA